MSAAPSPKPAPGQPARQSAGQSETPSPQPILARRLLRYALDTLVSLGPAERQLALTDLEGFIEKPSPAQFLMAMRRLRQLRHAAALQNAQLSRAEQDFARGLQALRGELGTRLADALAALPAGGNPSEPDSTPALGPGRLPPVPTGMRLRSLALLLAAHHELADRVAGRADALRQHLARAKDAQDQKASKPPPRRRPAEPRPIRQSTVTSTKK